MFLSLVSVPARIRCWRSRRPVDVTRPI